MRVGSLAMPIVRRGVIFTVALALGSLGVATPVEAEPDSPCTKGDAQSLFENIEISFEILLRNGLDHPQAETILHCQWRFFWEDGHPFFGNITFSEEDFILGGIVLYIDYPVIRTSRRDAVAELEGIQVRTWLAEVTNGQVGPLIAQPLMISATRDVVLRQQEIGKVAARTWGYITQLPAGEYRGVTEIRHADPNNHFWDADYTVDFTVTPSSG